MEVKKSKKAEIESHRGTWLLMGFIVVLAFMFVSFEWAQYDKQIDTTGIIRGMDFGTDVGPVILPVTPPPPPPPVASTTDVLAIIDNNSVEPEGTVAPTENLGAGVTAGYIPLEPDEVAPVEIVIVDFAEIMPSFQGGVSALNAFLAKEIKYPAISIENGAQGRVIVQFVVDIDGSITNAQVVRGIDPHLDKEALRVINKMPKWSPGKQGGKAVRVKYTVPVVFRLQ